MSRILVPLDESRLAEHALGWAALLARTLNAPLHLVSVWNADEMSFERAGIDPGEPVAAIRAAIQAYLDEVAARPLLHSLTVTSEVRLGDAASEIVEAAGIDTRMVVLTSHGRGGLKRALRGSVADKLIRLLPIPVLVDHPGGEAPLLTRVLVTLDGSEKAELALGPARELAKAAGARVHLLRVFNLAGYFSLGLTTPGLPRDFDALAADASQAARRYLEEIRLEGESIEVRGGSPFEAILDCARERGCEIIVMASRGSGGVTRFALGSTADSVVRAADRPVIVITGPAEEAGAGP